ncbi:MAG: hypothetical protein JNL90_09220 [Planctomycetes bacterium]|nr:hypothetical protein [Planctomycetota bacterium]
MPDPSLSAYAFADDDEDDDDDELLRFGAKQTANTASAQAKFIGTTGAAVAGGVTTVVGQVSNVARLVQTGSLLSAASTGTSAALAPVVAVTGPIGIALSLVDSLLSGASAVSTYGHIKQLEKLLQAGVPGHRPVLPGTREAIVFACKKKNKKLKRKGIGCIPVLGSICNTVYTIGRTIQKSRSGTKGVERRHHAKVLWANARCDDPLAIAACKELLGKKIYAMIEGMNDGDRVLKKKMKSL